MHYKLAKNVPQIAKVLQQGIELILQNHNWTSNTRLLPPPNEIIRLIQDTCIVVLKNSLSCCNTLTICFTHSLPPRMPLFTASLCRVITSWGKLNWLKWHSIDIKHPKTQPVMIGEKEAVMKRLGCWNRGSYVVWPSVSRYSAACFCMKNFMHDFHLSGSLLSALHLLFIYFNSQHCQQMLV